MKKKETEEKKEKEEKEETEKTEEKEKRTSKTYEGLSTQIQAEYDMAWKHQKPKKDRDATRLKLNNNQKRDPSSVGDTTMFTTHQTVLASLYNDKLTSKFAGREEGDDEVANNLDNVAEKDYDDMGKAKLDYDYIWDTTFFGHGVLALEEFFRDPDTNTFLPVPEVIDPMVFLHDPKASSINGDRKHRGGCSFFGLEVSLTQEDIENIPGKLDDIDYTELNHGAGIKSLYMDASEARNSAQNRETQKFEAEASLGVNASYIITRWYTFFEINGVIKRVKVWLANDRSKLLAVDVLDNQDYWQFTDRQLYPSSHDWDGTSIPDLTEDKQRARAVAQNLGLKAMESDLYPSYIYDTNKIENRAELTRIASNKYIGVDANGEPLSNAVMPLVKARPNMALLNFIYSSLDESAQKATATPDFQQGMQSDKDRPLGETNLLASRVDVRNSLASKIFGLSEQDFWRQWYRLYKDNLSDLDEKILRIEGPFGPKWRKLTRSNIISLVDPDIKIESKAENRAKQLEDRAGMTQYLEIAFANPDTNQRYGLKKLAKLYGMERAEIERLFPLTIDEREAQQENDLLNNNKIAEVKREQDHNVHLIEHMKTNDTPASRSHIKTHQQALLIRRDRPDLFPEEKEPMQPSLNVQGVQRRPGIAPSQTS